jgi:endonuclease-3
MAMLVATVLSQNTNDRNSHRAWTEFRRRFPRWTDAAAAPPRAIEAAIRSGGMARQKSRRIAGLLAVVYERYGGHTLAPLRRMPDDRVMRELTSIDGVGPKTAACVLLFSLGREVFPVDTHIHRIAGRLALVRGCSTPERTFEAMRPLVPSGKAYSLHTNLIRFGRRVCRSAKPLCGVCPFTAICRYPGRKARRTGGVSAADRDFMLLDNVAGAA